MKEIQLTQGKVTIVDDDDFEWLNQWKWNLASKGYAKRNIPNGHGGQTTLKMHRLIVGLSIGDPEQVDHKNGQKNDNRRDNLRICKPGENSQNRGKNKNNASGYKGVNFHKAHKKWCARIGVGRKRISLGFFDNKEDAYKAYCEAAKKYHGEFAKC